MRLLCWVFILSCDTGGLGRVQAGRAGVGEGCEVPPAAWGRCVVWQGQSSFETRGGGAVLGSGW